MLKYRYIFVAGTLVQYNNVSFRYCGWCRDISPHSLRLHRLLLQAEDLHHILDTQGQEVTQQLLHLNT